LIHTCTCGEPKNKEQMPVVKVGGGLSGGNSGSSGNAVEYLEKENKVRKKSERSTEGFFNQKSLDIRPDFAIKKLDSKRQGIKKHEAKFYNLIISPSQKELAELTDDDLKDYTKDLMIKYAENFNRGTDPNDLVWFAKLEKKRKYKGFKEKKNDKLNLPPGVKSGDYKSGDNRHIHVLVRRKTEKNMSLSPLAHQREGTTKGAAVGKVGFNRIKFSATAETLMINQIRKVNPDYDFKFDDLQAYKFLKKNDNDYERAIELGFDTKDVNKIFAQNEEIKAEQARDKVSDSLYHVMNTVPHNLKEYQSALKDLGVKLKPIFNEEKEPVNYNLHFKGEKIRLSEIDKTGFFLQMLEMANESKKSKKIRKELVLELRGAFNQAMEKNPIHLKEYQSILKDLGVRVKGVFDESGKSINYNFHHKGQKFKPSEIDDRATQRNILITVRENKKAEQPLTSAEKVIIAINFHQNENYDGKLPNPNPSPHYDNNTLVKAVESKYGFKITEKEFETTFIEIKFNNKGKGLSR
jgi:hypothetical protein